MSVNADPAETPEEAASVEFTPLLGERLGWTPTTTTETLLQGLKRNTQSIPSPPQSSPEIFEADKNAGTQPF